MIANQLSRSSLPLSLWPAMHDDALQFSGDDDDNDADDYVASIDYGVYHGLILKATV